jgi:hypothetical protein
MTRVRLIFTHGIGSQTPGAGWDSTLAQRCVARLASQGVLADVQLATWGDAIENEIATPRIALASQGVRFGVPRRVLWQYGGDALLYGASRSARTGVLDRVERTVLSDDTPVVLVAHSWGTVVACDALRRMMDASGAPLPAIGLVTFGSPLALTGTDYDGGHPWINLHDPLDPVGTPLNGIRQFACEDVRVVTTPWYQRLRPVAGPILAHTSYWQHATVRDAIVRMASQLVGRA